MSESAVACPRCGHELPARSQSDVCPECGHQIRRCAGCGSLLPQQPQERCANASCRARLLYLPLSGGQPLRALHLYAEVVYEGVTFRVDGILRQPNDGTTLYHVSAVNERAFRKRFHEAPPKGPHGGHALALKETVLECRGAPAGRGTSPEEFAALMAKLSNLKHPGLVRTYTGWDEGLRRYTLMHALQGQSIGEQFLRADRPGAGVPVRTLRHTATALGDAIAYLHEQGIWHRDITPSNVVWEGDRPVIVDFGTAVLSGAPGNARTPLTHRYAPLELYADSGLPVDARVDQYLLGSLLFCMAWGVPADFYVERTGLYAVALAPDRLRARRGAAADPQRRCAFYRPDLPAPFARAIDQLMGLRPEDRFADDAAMRRALAARSTRLSLPARRGPVFGTTVVLLLLSGWLGTRVSPGVRAEWHLRRAAALVADGDVREAASLREQAQEDVRQGTPLWGGRVAAARLAYGQACLDAGWQALNRGDARRGARLAREATRMLGTSNSSSAKELLRRCRTLSPRE